MRASPRSSCHRRRQPEARVLCHRRLHPRMWIRASASNQRQGFHEYFASCEGCHLGRHKLSAGGLARTPLYQDSVCVHGMLQHHSSMHSSHAEQSTYSVQQLTTTTSRRQFWCAASMHLCSSSSRIQTGCLDPHSQAPQIGMAGRPAQAASANVQHPLTLRAQAESAHDGCLNQCSKQPLPSPRQPWPCLSFAYKAQHMAPSLLKLSSLEHGQSATSSPSGLMRPLPWAWARRRAHAGAA